MWVASKSRWRSAGGSPALRAGSTRLFRYVLYLYWNSLKFQRLVMQINAIEKDGLRPCGLLRNRGGGGVRRGWRCCQGFRVQRQIEGVRKGETERDLQSESEREGGSERERGRQIVCMCLCASVREKATLWVASKSRWRRSAGGSALLSRAAFASPQSGIKSPFQGMS